MAYRCDIGANYLFSGTQFDTIFFNGIQVKASIFRVEVISAKHISSPPKGESNSMVELQIGGAAAPEWVWRSRSPAKHALKFGHIER
jgi:hypothetical protein